MSHAIPKTRSNNAARTNSTPRAQDIRVTWCPIGMPFSDLAPPVPRRRARRATRATSQPQAVRTE